MRSLSTAILACFILLVGVVRAAEENPGEQAIREAITILEARKAQTEKKEDQERIATAISNLEKLLPKMKEEGEAKADADLAKLITPALLKKKFAGKAVFNPKTGELTLIYAFTDKGELADFDLGGSKPSVAAGVLKLQGGQSITHVVDFKTLTVTGVITVSGEKFTKRISTTNGASMNTTTSMNGQFFSISVKKQEQAFEKIPGLSGSFQFSVEAKRVAAKWGTISLGKEATETQGGQIALHGATKGTQFQKLVISGKIDPTWAVKFFGE